MLTRVLSRLALQPLLNTLAAALLLLSGPTLTPAIEADPLIAHIALHEPAETAGEPALKLPLTFTDRMGIAEIAPLPAPLTVDGTAPMRAHRAGDIAYLASEQSVVVFLSDGTTVPDADLVLLGHVTSGLDKIAGCVRDCAVQLVAESER